MLQRTPSWKSRKSLVRLWNSIRRSKIRAGVQINSSCRTVVLTPLVTTFLSSYFLSDNWKYPKASTSPQLKYSTFVCITSHFPYLHHAVTLWLFLDFSRVLGISCSFSKQTSVTSTLIGSYWNPTFYWNNCYLFVVKFKL